MFCMLDFILEFTFISRLILFALLLSNYSWLNAEFALFSVRARGKQRNR